tara:strand:- start:221 stop:1213 length:993 start_codon:yes stop_codon:yes gene_type:complete
MSEKVLTPITQALNDGILTRKELKALMRRSDVPAFKHLAIWVVALAITTTLIAISIGGPWFVPAMFLHGIIVVHHFSLQHECCHYTVFATRKVNDIVGQICGFLTLVPNQFFRYEHCDHHNFTQLKGKDPELIELPISAKNYLFYISAIPYWWGLAKSFGLHVAGQIPEHEAIFIPKEVRGVIIREARFYAVGYAAIAVLSIAAGWAGALWFWVIPSLMAQPVMRAIRMTEHVGRPNVTDLRENTRTNLVSRPMQFLCWNMNYHAEHHYTSSVPYHALPRLNKILDGYIYVEPRGYLGAHIDIIRQIVGRKPRADQPAQKAAEEGDKNGT